MTLEERIFEAIKGGKYEKYYNRASSTYFFYNWDSCHPHSIDAVYSLQFKGRAHEVKKFEFSWKDAEGEVHSETFEKGLPCKIYERVVEVIEKQMQDEVNRKLGMNLDLFNAKEYDFFYNTMLGDLTVRLINDGKTLEIAFHSNNREYHRMCFTDDGAIFHSSTEAVASDVIHTIARMFIARLLNGGLKYGLPEEIADDYSEIIFSYFERRECYEDMRYIVNRF